MDFVESIRQFNLMAGNTDDRFNVRQSALYFGLQLEEMGEKLRHLGFKVMGQQLDTLGRDMKKGAFDFVFEDRRIADLILDDDVDQLVVTIGSMLSQGADVPGALAEVHRANMAKVFPDGTLHKDANGKIMKPEGFVGPDLRPFVDKGGHK